MDKNITERQFVEHCAKLLWGYNWASCHHNDESSEHLSNDWSDYYIPKGLCDEDKFLCFIIGCELDSCLNSCFFINVLGWTKYKATKIRKKIPYMTTMACVGENGGYNGKGWAFDYDFKQKINEYQKKNKCCVDCARPYIVKIDGELIKSNSYFCPINRYLVGDRYGSHCGVIKLVPDEEFKNFWG